MLFLLIFLVHKVDTLRCPASEAFPVPHEWFQPGDLVIGGMVSQIFYNFYEIEFKDHPSLKSYDLPVVVTKFYQHVLALAFAVKDINEDFQILPNATLGFHIYDSYYNPRMTYHTTLDLLFKSKGFFPNYKCDNQKNLMGIIGGLDASTSSYMAESINLFKIPQKLHPLLSQNGICLSFTQRVPQRAQLEEISEFFDVILTISNQLIDQKANVLLVYGESFTILWLRTVVFLYDYENKESASFRKVWILMYPIDFILIGLQRAWDVQLFHGSLSFTVHSREIQGFKEFIQVIKPSTHKDGFLQEVWEQLFDCSLSNEELPSVSNETCSGEENLETLPAPLFELQMTAQSYSIYNAFYAVAHSLQEAVRSKSQHRRIKNFEFSNLRPWQVLPISLCNHPCSPGYWKKGVEEKEFCCYDCVPCPEGKISNQNDMDDCFECSEDHYPNKERNGCILKMMVFLTFEEILGNCLALTAVCCFFLTSWVLGIFIKHRDTPIVKANNRSLTYILLISLQFCFLSSLFFLSQPSKVTCLLRQPTFGITFSVAISSVLAKTITVVVAFMASKPGSQMRKWVGKRLPFCTVLSCSLFQVCICILWSSIYPPFSELDMHSELQEMILQCNEGSAFFFYCVLGYMGALAIASFVVAFLARKLPDSFNEAKFITFSMLAFCSVWISFFPAYLSTKGKAMVAVEVFSILSSSTALLGCIFLPKCYIIVFSPELNQREQLIKRT
ncbi:vomeronasal type-2 receptor 26-like [Crotalus tigris]|uniref:vomeronasal type-2 receptor 26-like n=1 Tax=Crotalus tigris TaxID=88082 RepID=UPI00192F63B5|nr:vomeronasal type-2 receptor 26-like [Crotalus tigris]